MGRRPGTNPYLEGNYAPVSAELTVEAVLPMEGAIPPSLEGLLLRNGPNPATEEDPATYHWFSGDGMVHAVELREGRAVAYRNRWVRTRKLARALGTRPPRGPEEPIDGPANTHVLWHGGKLLALCESGFPHRLTVGLDTRGVEDFDGMLTSPLTAHPHADPETGGLAAFGYDVFGPPFLRYHEFDVHGAVVHSTELELPRATMQHDFGVTATRVVFMDLSVVFDLDLAASGRALPFSWQPEAGARLGILDRGRPGSEVRWIDLEPCYVFHVANAFDQGPAIVMDVLRYEQSFDTGPGQLISSDVPALERWTIDPEAGRLDRRQLDDRPAEFPRVDDLVSGRPYRHAYCVEMARTEAGDDYRRLLRYDLSREEATVWEPGAGCSPSEPVFVRDPEGRADDEGWLLTVVFDAGRQASDLVVLDAQSLRSKPEAVVHLPARVPFGFHGSWVPAALYR